MAFFKDDPLLAQVEVRPDRPFSGLPGQDTELGRMARTYNRTGGLFEAFSQRTGVPVGAALAVWQVESGGADFTPGRAILRFENHKFWDHWGKGEPSLFDAHFQFGGRAGVAGRRWENHRFRAAASDTWHSFHGTQSKEYDVFGFASSLAGRELATLASSFGGPQILGSNFAALGYDSAAAMHDALQVSERWHVCGFFDFCATNGILDDVKALRWRDFAKVYNGASNVDEYAPKLAGAFDVAGRLGSLPRGTASAESAPDGFDLTAFTAFIEGLGLRHFKAYELLTKGAQHSNPDSAAFGLNTDPPRDLWPNIAATISVLDALRERLGAPVVPTSVYRSPTYNSAIAGAGASQHMEFNAIDFVVRNHMSPDTWASALKDMRASGVFSGGIGTYPGFVHVDTRGNNATW